EAQVVRTPGAIALACSDEQLSYTELNRRANQLARYLQTLGVRPESRVGLCLERSAELMVGLLGILKAGGAYVPLDPSYPTERLAFMLSDAQMSAIVTRDRYRTSLPVNGVPVVRLDDDREAIASQSAENPGGEVQPENLAYVIYTSGSTGTPK